jgi:serine/threonine-protein kinase
VGSIGRYRIVKKLATGGMAEVYLAKVAGPGGFEKHVVVKQILPQLADSEMYVKMFLEEARLAAQLDHPNIVHVFDFGEVDGSYFLAMEYVEGANLRHVMRWAFRTGHPIPPTLSARIIALACEGLAYAHQFVPPGSDEITRLVHRDVSPENIMLSRTGAVKMLDFGVAKVTSEDNRSKVGSLKGKIAYMPPEQLRGGNIDHRVDIYALGIVLYQALCGKRPYGQATDVALIQAILNEEPTPLLKHRLDLPDNLLDIVSKAMAKDRADRFQSCEALRDALDAYIAHEGQPANAGQIAQLVSAYQQGMSDAPRSSHAGTGTSPSTGTSSSEGSQPGSAGGSSNAPLDPAPHATPAEADDTGLEGVTRKAPSEAKSLWPSGWKFGKSRAGIHPSVDNQPGETTAPEAKALSDEPPPPPPSEAQQGRPARIPLKTTPAAPGYNKAAFAAMGPTVTPAAAAPVVDTSSAETVLASGPPAAPAPRGTRSAPMISAYQAETVLEAHPGLPLREEEPPAVVGTPISAPPRFAPPVLTPRGSAPVPAPRASAPVLTPRPSAPPGSPQKPVNPGSVTQTFESLKLGAARADDPQATRSWRPNPIAAEVVRAAFREAVRADRSTTLLRKLPAVISRLTDFSASIPAPLAESFAGVIDAAMLSDDQAAVVRVLERATQRPGPEARFASLVSAELSSPLRMAWLVERLRSGLPGDVAGLRSWLLRIAPQMGPMMLDCLELSEPGPAQELFAEALATAISADPAPIVARMQEPKLRDLAALSFALERSGAPERTKVFNRLIGRREVPVQVEILTGRSKARGADALLLLEGALGDKSDEIRKRAIKLVGELCGLKGYALLLATLKDGSFESRPLAERALYWTAAFECGGDAAAAEVEQVLAAKASLLSKKKVNDAKLALIDGLGRSKSEAARAVLERVAGDRAQGDEVQGSAVSALEGSRRNSGEMSSEHKAIGEWRVHLLARISLDFLMLARATTAIDITSGLLDATLERFRDGVRQLVAQDGKLQLVFSAEGAAINGLPVSFGPLHDKVSTAIGNAMQARDLKGFAVESSLPAAEFRSLLLRAFDPEGGRERMPHIKAINFQGQPLVAASESLLATDPTSRSRELFAFLVRWLSSQREALHYQKGLNYSGCDAALDEWSRLIDAGQARFLGLLRWQPSDTGTLIHAASTAVLSMAFAHDLGLSRSALREVAELSMSLGLAEAVARPEQRPGPGEPTPEDARFYASGLVLTNRTNRLGTSLAVGTVEAGMPHTARGGPGLLASIHALAKAFDSLSAGNASSTALAIEAINGRLRGRFNPDLLGLFTQWAFAQGSA